jgi:hypothetical protein
MHPYADSRYAACFADIAQPRLIGGWRTPVLARPAPGGTAADATGLYPLAALAPDADIGAGLAELAAAGFVSAVMVQDPCSGPAPDRLAAGFPICRRYNTHYLVDRDRGPFQPSKHHRQAIGRANLACRVELTPLAGWLDAWAELYRGLIARRHVTGLALFSDAYFRNLATLDSLTTFGAFHGGRLVAMSLWLAADGLAFNHLGAAAAEGYRAGATYALQAAAIEHFLPDHLINLGGASGVTGSTGDGLTFFKAGFANRDVGSWLVGAILDPARYATLTTGLDHHRPFFPLYRAPDASLAAVPAIAQSAAAAKPVSLRR